MSISEKRFVDTNIFIYTLFKVDLSKYKASLSLFEQASQGAVKLWTTELVISEIVWFLSRKKMTWNNILLILKQVLMTKGLEVRERELIFAVIKKCEKSKDFIDGLNVALARKEGIQEGYSYDKGLEKWSGFTRKEP